jgi:hypothetical protein
MKKTKNEKAKEMLLNWHQDNADYKNPNDQKAYEQLKKAWESLSSPENIKALNQRTLFDDIKYNENTRIPATKKEIANFEYYLNGAKAADPMANELKEDIELFRNYLKFWKKRKFAGSNKLLVLSLIITLFILGIQISAIAHSGFSNYSDGTFAGILSGILITLGFALYYFSYKIPRWLKYAKNITGKVLFYEENLNAHSNFKDIAQEDKDIGYEAYKRKYNSNLTSEEYREAMTEREKTNTFVYWGLFVIQVITLPIVTYYAFIRFYGFVR